MYANPRTLIKHEGLHMLAIAVLTGFLFMNTIPEPFFRLDPSQKKEYLKSRYRRLRRRTEELLDLDPESDECE